jgi:Zn-finger nucleic acid-binding protein
MEDAYRSSPHVCPKCGNTALREFAHRVVCDECEGMLIAVDDLATSVHELDGKSGEVRFEAAESAKPTCPRCDKPMQTAEVIVGKIKLYGRSLYCAHDGVWVDRGVLAGVFALASRGNHSHSQGRTYGGAGNLASNIPGQSSGFGGALNSIRGAFGSGAPADSGLSISHWGTSRPRVHTLFVTAFKDRTFACAACAGPAMEFRGDRWECTSCHGVFVEDAALSAMVSEMTNAPWTLPETKGSDGDRVCPVCSKTMSSEKLETVGIDRCAGHGVFFDHDELGNLLEHAGQPHEVGSWVHRLFHRQ